MVSFFDFFWLVTAEPIACHFDGDKKEIIGNDFQELLYVWRIVHQRSCLVLKCSAQSSKFTSATGRVSMTFLYRNTSRFIQGWAVILTVISIITYRLLTFLMCRGLDSTAFESLPYCTGCVWDKCLGAIFFADSLIPKGFSPTAKKYNFNLILAIYTADTVIYCGATRHKNYSGCTCTPFPEPRLGYTHGHPIRRHPMCG